MRGAWPGLVLALLAGLGLSGDAEGPSRAAAPPGADATPAQDFLIVSDRGWRTDFSLHTVPLIAFQAGGPGRDGIPALDHPELTTVREASRWLHDREPVIEVTLGGESRAYPLQVLVWHEIVNDILGGRPVVVTYCPLCNSAMAFERRVASRTLSFGTTGNLRNYNLVMYDRQTESWWQQLDGTALVGELAGARMSPLAAPLRAWSEFARDHPGGTVLSRQTGYRRPYGSSPYVGLDQPRRSPTECGLLAVLGSAPTCPVNHDQRLPPRERVVLIERGSSAVAVPFGVLRRVRMARVRVGGERLEVNWSPGQRSPFVDVEADLGAPVGSAEVRSVRTGARIPASTPFWFAVAAANPRIPIWTRRGASD
jgi:Protein of unknown function (DUF3179)